MDGHKPVTIPTSIPGGGTIMTVVRKLFPGRRIPSGSSGQGDDAWEIPPGLLPFYLLCGIFKLRMKVFRRHHFSWQMFRLYANEGDDIGSGRPVRGLEQIYRKRKSAESIRRR